MRQVDFYLISNPIKNAKLKLACRLGNKIVRLGMKTFIYTEDETVTGELDQLLWTYSDTSFVPHECSSNSTTAETDPMVPLVISHRDPADDCNATALISLTAEQPTFCSRFDRIAEIVEFEEEDKAAARRRYKKYRDEGFTVNTHHIGL